MSSIKLFDILWRNKNAGPSPDHGLRTELYFAGCKKALSGNPCKNCFNPLLWDSRPNIEHTCEDIVNKIDMHDVPKFITIVGGEPTDQLDGLKELSKRLKDHGYNIVLFSWHDVDWFKSMFTSNELNNFDLIVTGPYDETERIYDTSATDGIRNSIGSGNQHAFFPKEQKDYRISTLASIVAHEDGSFTVMCKGDE